MRVVGLLLLLLVVAPAAAQLQRVAFVGDSTTTNPELAARHQWPRLVERRLGIVAHTLAMPGLAMTPVESLPGALALVPALEALDSFAPLHLVVILLGVNDWLHLPLEDFRTSYRRFIVDVETTGVPILCITPLPVADEGAAGSDGKRLEDYREIVREVCASHRVVEGPALMPAAPQTLADDLHPSWLGARYVARRLTPLIAELIGLEGDQS